MIKNHLSRILGDRRWTQARLAEETGIRPTTISHLYNEFAERVSFEQLDLICEALDCSISDLLEYIPNAQRQHWKEPDTTTRKAILTKYRKRHLSSLLGLLKCVFCFYTLQIFVSRFCHFKCKFHFR